jgi:hypothetical protein
MFDKNINQQSIVEKLEYLEYNFLTTKMNKRQFLNNVSRTLKGVTQ